MLNTQICEALSVVKNTLHAIQNCVINLVFIGTEVEEFSSFLSDFHLSEMYGKYFFVLAWIFKMLSYRVFNMLFFCILCDFIIGLCMRVTPLKVVYFR